MKRAFLTGSMICGLLATLPVQAPAATYTVYACSAGVDGGVNRSWTTWSTGNGYRASEDCAAGNPNPGGLRIRQNTMARMQLGSQTEWVFRAPSGTTILGMSGYRYLYDGWEDQTPYIRNATGWLESCPIAYTAAYCLLGSGGYGVGYPTWFSYPVGTGEVAMGVQCTDTVRGECVGGLPDDRPWVHMQLTNIRVEVSDPHRAVVAHVQGDLTQGWVRGTRAVTLTATDAQSGVGRLRVILARPGTPGAVITQDVACNYTLAVPCPTSVTHGFGVNTTTLPDGAYTFEAGATDATLAEANLGTLTGTVRIDNTAPAAPALTLAAGAIAPGAPITVMVKAPVDAGSPPVSTNYRVTTPDGKIVATGTHKDASRIEGITAPAGRSTITAWMTDEAGNTDPTRSASLVLDTSA